MIADLGGHLRRNAPERRHVVDCSGAIVAPGLVDMRVFVGEPGAEHRETFASAGQAAAAGGVTTIVVMPDTEPVIDQVALVDFIQRRARDNAIVNVHVMAAMTRGLKGQDMAEIGLLKRAGAIAFSNGKSSVATPASCATYCSTARTTPPSSCITRRTPPHRGRRVMNAGEVATRLAARREQGGRDHRVERDLRPEITGGRHPAATPVAESWPWSAPPRRASCP